jgi:hypothetical protein
VGEVKRFVYTDLFELIVIYSAGIDRTTDTDMRPHKQLLRSIIEIKSTTHMESNSPGTEMSS